MIKITLQKDVIIRTESQAITLNHTQFKQWLLDNKIAEFVFRPGDKSDTGLSNQRIKRILGLGYSVTESGQSHHYMRATL